MAIVAATSFAAKQPHTLREFSQFISTFTPSPQPQKHILLNIFDRAQLNTNRGYTT